MAGRKRPTLRQIAELTGLSVSTVSRALAGKNAISEDTRRRVAKTANELGYRPNAQARALQRQSTGMIGIIVPSLINHFFASMVTAAQQCLQKHDLSLLILNSEEEPRILAKSLAHLIDQGVDGIICVPLEQNAPEIEDITKTGVPLVFIDREIPELEIPTVMSDPYPGMKAAIKLIAKNKLAPVGYLSGPMSTSTARHRLATFTELTEGMPPHPQSIYLGGFDRAAGRAGAAKLLDLGARTLFAGDSMMTIGVLEEYHRRRREGLLAQGIAIIGFDQQPAFHLQPRPLTVIDQNVEIMANTAVETLLTMLGGQQPEELTQLIPTVLIEKESTSPSTEPFTNASRENIGGGNDHDAEPTHPGT